MSSLFQLRFILRLRSILQSGSAYLLTLRSASSTTELSSFTRYWLILSQYYSTLGGRDGVPRSGSAATNSRSLCTERCSSSIFWSLLSNSYNLSSSDMSESELCRYEDSTYSRSCLPCSSYLRMLYLNNELNGQKRPLVLSSASALQGKKRPGAVFLQFHFYYF